MTGSRNPNHELMRKDIKHSKETLMRILISVLALGTTLIVFGYTAMAYEEPSYKVIEQRDDYEIRVYEPYLVAETTVDGNFKNSGNSAFSILAGYIFGNNAGSEKMEMTVPVTSQGAPKSGMKMNMTVPVTSSPVIGSDGNPEQYIYQFVMEGKYTLDTLPKPNDARINLREMPARTVAVRRYSGRRTGENYSGNLSELLSDLERDQIDVDGTPQAAFYDGPWTPPFLRRNEILVEVDYSAG